MKMTKFEAFLLTAIAYFNKKATNKKQRNEHNDVDNGFWI